MSNEEKGPRRAISRRGFLKSTGLAAGGVLALGTASTALSSLAFAEEKAESSGDRVVYGHCRSNCNGGCRFAAHVRDGKIVKLEPADYPDEGYKGCCLKGISYIDRIYNPERIKYPMRRVGERGAGEWERISWDEAINEIATKFADISKTYGATAIGIEAASGNWSVINGIYGLNARLAACMGANKLAVCYDYACGHGINRVLGTGDWYFANEPNSVVDSSMTICWGTNPVFTSPQNWRWIQRAKEQGTKVVTIDPIKSATAHKSDQWIPVTPGHDGYLALAMANYVIKNDLVDQKFLKERTTAAFLVRRDTQAHLRVSDVTGAGRGEIDPISAFLGMIDWVALGGGPEDFMVWDKAVGKAVPVAEAVDPAMEGSFTTEGGIEVDTAYSLLKKHLSQYTISEASKLSGVTEKEVEAFAKEFATEDAVSIFITYGLDHYTNGHLTIWAITILLALTGNLARAGAGFVGVFFQTYTPNLLALWAGGPDTKAFNVNIPSGRLHEMFRDQAIAGHDYPMKALFSACANPMSNFAAQNNFINEILPNLEFWVVVDMEMTDSARHADIVLPQASWWEVEDFTVRYCLPYTLHQEKAFDPLYESKADYEIFSLIGRAMGYEKSFPEGWGFEEWAALALSDPMSQQLGVTIERLRSEHVIQTTGVQGTPFIRGRDIPFPSESGRAQLYFENPTPRLDYGQDWQSKVKDERLVYYRAPLEADSKNPLFEKYPLVFLQEHARFRTHSQWFEVPCLREIDQEPVVKVNGVDAEARGVKNGDIVEVFNDRGHAVVRCVVDESICPGVVSIPKGWQRHQYIAGCYQEMTQPEMDIFASSFAYYDTLVDFKKWEEQ